MKLKTVKEIVKEYLEANGHDGLFNPDAECGCYLDNLVPCACINEECMSGYAVRLDGQKIITPHKPRKAINKTRKKR